MTAHSFLPYILQSTRVTDHSVTVTDNIFSNITYSESISGNLTTLISDHFIQFMFIKKYHPKYKSCNYYVHDYSNFGKEKFIHDFSLIDWSPLNDSPELVNNNFDYFYSKVTSCVEFHVPKKSYYKWLDTQIQALDRIQNSKTDVPQR